MEPAWQKRISSSSDDAKREAKLTLTELVAPRVAYNAGVAQSVIGSCGENSLTVVAVVPNEMRRGVMTRTLFEEARGGRGRVEEPLLFMDED